MGGAVSIAEPSPKQRSPGSLLLAQWRQLRTGARQERLSSTLSLSLSLSPSRKETRQWTSLLCEPQHSHHTMGGPPHSGVGGLFGRLVRSCLPSCLAVAGGSSCRDGVGRSFPGQERVLTGLLLPPLCSGSLEGPSARCREAVKWLFGGGELVAQKASGGRGGGQLACLAQPSVFFRQDDPGTGAATWLGDEIYK